MRFLIDAQLSPRLALWFGEQGLSATAVRRLGLRDSDDGSIWNFAVAGNWTIVTKDEDFVSRCRSDSNAPSVVWIRIGNCTNRALFERLKPILSEIIERIAQGEKLIEIR
jgi:predicted nuclease of predicted toxin-antitoxin system